LNSEDAVTWLVAANGGTMVGKTRLQKTVYLLGRCGLKTDIEFDYHYFGPFSAELAVGADAAQSRGRIAIEERAGFHDVPYAVFTTEEAIPNEIGGAALADVKRQLGILSKYTAIELELAATIDFLRDSEGIAEKGLDQTVSELKPVKSNPDRLKRAHELLQQLGLE
jgi:uncharacterized protein